jgi:hypothetical protein
LNVNNGQDDPAVAQEQKGNALGAHARAMSKPHPPGEVAGRDSGGAGALPIACPSAGAEWVRKCSVPDLSRMSEFGSTATYLTRINRAHQATFHSAIDLD